MLVSINLLVGCGNGDKQKIDDLQDEIETYEKENSEDKEKIEQLEEEIKTLKEDKEKVEYKNQQNKEVVKKEVPKSISYSTYTNGRYGFSLIYPSDFVKGPEPANGDGLQFTGENGRVTLTASAGHNALMQSVQEMYEQAIQGKSCSYKNVGEDFFVLSWEENGVVNYEYRKVVNDIISGFIISYPKDMEDKYNPVVEKIYSSFKPSTKDF